MRHQVGLVGAVLVFLLASLLVCAQDSASPLLYKLHAGDHLTYREVFEREGQSTDQSFRTRVVFLNHLVVLDEAGGTALVGVQRNRQAAELLEYREHGKDRLAQESAKFASRIAKRPQHFSDANIFNASGLPQTPIQTVREAYSKLLYGISEIEPLPAGRVQTGAETRGPLGMTMRLTKLASGAGESCAELTDTGTRKDTHLNYVFCPQPGALAKLEFSGEYHEFGDSLVRERVSLELVQSRRDENPSSWLSDPDVQQAALDAYLLAGAAAPDPERLAALLRSSTSEAQALALAVYYQRSLRPPAELLTALSTSKDEEVQRLVSRFSVKPSQQPPGVCPLPARHYQREKPGTTLRSMTASGFEGRRYIIHVPIDYRGDQAFPLMIYLSGGGGQAFDGALTAEDAIGRSGYLAVYPNAGGELWWEEKPTAMVHALLLEVLRNYNVDTNRVYLAGFSNGGTGSLYMGTLWPDRFAAIASLMGAGEHLANGDTLPLKNLLNVPVLFLHGDKDNIIPYFASATTYDELRALHPRTPPELHILKERGHDITLTSDDSFTLPFLERFRREPFPRTLAMKISNLNYPRRYWIEVVEKDSGPAEVEARILPDNIIELKTKNVRKLRLLLRPELLSNTTPARIRLNGKEQPAQEMKHNCELFTQSTETYADPFLAYTDEVVLSVTK